MIFLVIEGTRHWLSISNLFFAKHRSGKTSVPGLFVYIRSSYIKIIGICLFLQNHFYGYKTTFNDTSFDEELNLIQLNEAKSSMGRDINVNILKPKIVLLQSSLKLIEDLV